MSKSKRPYLLPKPLLCDPAEIENGISMELVEEYVRKHEARFPRYEYLENLYRGFHDVFKAPEKPYWKPDNRLAVNFPRYITETFLGYAYGIPVKKDHPNEAVEDALTEFEDINDMTDHEYELFKKACIYGHAWEYFYQDEERHTRVIALNPKDLFVVYDDTMQNRALFAVRYGRHSLENTEAPGEIFGEILTREQMEPFDGSRKTGELLANPYGYIPCVEYRMNDDRIGLYEEVTGLVEAYNRAIGEKANDVDAFAEAYLAVLGAELDDKEVYRIRDDRIINMYGTDDAKDIIVQFLSKPTADATQENLLDRLENLIYQTSMVANISDEAFGSNSSGTSLAYKLQAMSNLALGFDRKIEKSMRKRYKIFCSLQTNVSDPDAWREVRIKTTRNLPKNYLEEAQTAQALEGIVSQKTQLSVLSIVDNVSDEIEQIEKEKEESQNDAVMRQMFGGEETDGDGRQNLLDEAGNGTAQT